MTLRVSSSKDGVTVFELLLRVEVEGRPPADVHAQLSADHTVADLAAALCAHLQAVMPPGHEPTLGCDHLAGRLHGRQFAYDSGLISGDVVTLGSLVQQPSQPLPVAGSGLYCEVVSGASSGSSLALSPGRFTIGRDPGCHMTLDDPTVSRHHAVLAVDTKGRVRVAPAAQVTNPVLVDGAQVAGQTPLKPESLLQLGGTALVIRHRASPVTAARDQLGQIPFNRTPYRHPDLRPIEVRGPGRPPKPPEPRPLMLLATLLPLAGAVAFALLLGQLAFLLLALLSPLSMLANWWSDRRRGAAGYEQQLATFERRFTDWIARYDHALNEERRRRTEAAPDLADLARRAEQRAPDLWPRHRRAEAFLQLRLGLGPIPPLVSTPPPDNVDDDPAHRIESAIEARCLLASMPITVDLLEQGTIAIYGALREVEATAASLLLQAAVLHSPEDLVICGALDPQRSLHGWAKWLPHTRSVSSPLAGEHLASDTTTADDLLRRLAAVIAERSGETSHWPRILLVLDELLAVDPLLVAGVLESGHSAGIVAVWVGQSETLVPRQAAAVLDCPPAATGRLARYWTTDPAEPPVELDPDRLGLDAAPRLARALAPVRDASSGSAAASIPRIAPLLESLGAPTLVAEQVIDRWSRPTSYGLAAPIGIGPAGPLTIDLVEHGPHALIAGTSGAGKSELLQSAIAALIANYPPTRLNLLFIDYKGGASSNLFQPAPHTVGYVTNLGADLAMRALVSLRAELDRRMRILEGRAKDLEEMLERYPDEAPASLVIVVDEFATLVKEIPDFVTGMVDIAQRGRSLGIHLILATQRPAGAVNDNILANTNLRISLRVLDPSDSSSILGSGEAATIPAPLRGRGFARLGAGGLIEFQSAYAGAPFTAVSGTTPVEITDFPASEAVTLYPPPVAAVADEAAATHLDVLIKAVVGATERLGLQRGRRPWLEDLPGIITLDEIAAGRFGAHPDRIAGRDVIIGVIDEPHRQAQRPYLVDLEDTGGLLVFGTGGSGKTTTLRTIIGSAVRDASPREVEVHILDFAGRTLDALDDLPHVAGVATGDDLERTTRMLMHLRAEVARRQNLLATVRAENLSAFNRQQPTRALPRLLLVLDGYEAFDRTFERGDLYLWSELLVETVLAGRSVGLHLVASAARRVSIPAGLSNAISGRLILRTADVDGLMDLGVPPAIARDARLGNGRALLPAGDALQVAVVGDDVSNAGQTDLLESWSTTTTDGVQARLPELPASVSGDVVGDIATDGPMAFVLGLADLTLQPVVCDLRLQNLAVIGPAESGRSTALLTAARALRRNGGDLWVIADAMSPLAAEPWEHLAVRRDEQRALVDELARVAATSSSKPILVVDPVERVSDEVGMTLEALLRDDAVRVVAAAEPSTLGGYVMGWAGELRRTRRILLLQPDDATDLGTLTSVRIRLRPGQQLPPGRGVFINNRDWDLVQVLQPGTAGDGAQSATSPNGST